MVKNICMVAYTIYKTDARVRREAETLARHGYRVRFITLAEKKKAQTYHFNGVDVYEINMHKYNKKNPLYYTCMYVTFLFHAMFICSKLTLQGNVDAVHIHNMPDFLVFAAIIPRLLGKKIILDIHDSVPETYSGKFPRMPQLLYKLLCIEEAVSAAFAHRIICVNHIQMIPLVNRGIKEKKITVLLNVPDHSIFDNQNRIHDTGKNEPLCNLVYHGTLDKLLGIDFAIKTIAQLIVSNPDIHFHVFGDGKDSDEFITLVNKLQVKNNIHIQKTMYAIHEIPHLLASMHIGVIPNQKTATTEYMLPVKLLEYIALGIPAVAPRLRTIQYYFSSEMLSYYEPGNIDSLSHALLSLYNDKKKRIHQAVCAKKIFDIYGWQRHQYDLLAVYKGI